MRYYRCNCGKTEFFGSGMGPAPCEECSHCHTTALMNDDGTYKKPIPHEFVAHDVETDEGPKPVSYCKYCHKTKSRIAEASKTS